MARAVLFQDAVAKTVGLNSTDLQLSSLLISSARRRLANWQSDPG